MSCEASPATEPIFPLGDVGEAVTVHEGRMSIDGREVDGRIEFRLMPRPLIMWRVAGPDRPKLGPVSITLPSAGGDTQVEAECNSRGLAESSGAISDADLSAHDVDIDRVIVNWLNLPSVRSPGAIYDRASRRTFAGRWTAVVNGWRLTLDERADHREMWRRARDTGAIVMTHVMDIRREDGAAFTAAEIEPVIDALQLGFSFALGRMVSPVLPVGLNPAGDHVWQQWSSRLCTAGAPGALRWWFEEREWELAELLDQLVRRFSDPDAQFSMRFLLTSAVLSAAGGFVEQRVMTAFAALEHFAWTRLVVTGELTQDEYDQLKPASGRLAAVLQRAGISCEIDDRELPALREVDAWLPANVCRTGPVVAAWVRNKIVHPAAHGDVVYRHEKLLEQAWLLVNHYLVLLILHDLDYRGSYQRRLVPGGWAGEVEPVPWLQVSDS